MNDKVPLQKHLPSSRHRAEMPIHKGLKAREV